MYTVIHVCIYNIYEEKRCIYIYISSPSAHILHFTCSKLRYWNQEADCCASNSPHRPISVELEQSGDGKTHPVGQERGKPLWKQNDTSNVWNMLMNILYIWKMITICINLHHQKNWLNKTVTTNLKRQKNIKKLPQKTFWRSKRLKVFWTWKGCQRIPIDRFLFVALRWDFQGNPQGSMGTQQWPPILFPYQSRIPKDP